MAEIFHSFISWLNDSKLRCLTIFGMHVRIQYIYLYVERLRKSKKSILKIINLNKMYENNGMQSNGIVSFGEL